MTNTALLPIKGICTSPLRSSAMAIACLAALTFSVTARAQDESTESSGSEAAGGEAAAAVESSEALAEEGDSSALASPSTGAAEDEADEVVAEEAVAEEAVADEAVSDEAVSDEAEGDEEILNDEAAAEEAQAEAEPLAWRNSFFSWTQGLTFNSFVRDGQQTYDPYYYWSFSLLPRWYIDSRLFLIASIGLSYELTDSNTDTYNHELALSDALVELRYTTVVDRFVFIPAVRLTVPTSKASQAAQRYFNTGLGLTSVLQIPEFLGSNIALGLAYRRWWAASNVALSQNPYTGQSTFSSNYAGSGAFDALSGDVGATSIDSMGGAATGADRLLVALTFNVTPVSGLTLTLQGLMIFDRPFDNAAGFVGCDTVLTQPCDQPLEIEMNPDQNRWRTFTYFTLAAAYDVQPWLNLQLGIANAASLAPLFNDNGTVRSPFNTDTQVYLSATFTLDGIYSTITEGGEDDGLTPEQRQRRRQGLALLDSSDEETDLEGSPREDEDETSRSLVAF